VGFAPTPQDQEFSMTSARLLRRFLVRFPWLFRALNAWLPAPVLQVLRGLAEKLKYRDVDTVHDLPSIFHYWSQRYLLPMMQEMGYESLDELFLQHIARFRDRERINVVSIGCGNCEPDIRLVRMLLDRGIDNLRYECIEFNGDMLERAREEARKQSVDHVMLFTQADIARWNPQTKYEVVLASQFLHHVPALEKLFDTIHFTLSEDGVFLVSDIIGRNGHMRWPEALELLNTLWSQLDDAHKFHHLHGQVNREFVNWDCSLTGFEGIRAQDILPLLLERFFFESFLAFGNLIDVFVDRPYGPNFDVNNPADLLFIDRVHESDQVNLASGRISPTHMLAVLRKSRPERTQVFRNMTPEFCVRRVDA
jgi:SAM-dependent methyltransferase